MKEGTIKITWQCEKCKDVQISYSTLRHDMNVCKCGKSAIDLEEYYSRSMGSPKELNREKLINNEWENYEKQYNFLSNT